MVRNKKKCICTHAYIYKNKKSWNSNSWKNSSWFQKDTSLGRYIKCSSNMLKYSGFRLQQMRYSSLKLMGSRRPFSAITVASFGITIPSITPVWYIAVLLIHPLTLLRCAALNRSDILRVKNRSRTWFFHVSLANFKALSLLYKNNSLYSSTTCIFSLAYSGEGKKSVALLPACSTSVPPVHGSAAPSSAVRIPPIQMILGLMDVAN